MAVMVGRHCLSECWSARRKVGVQVGGATLIESGLVSTFDASGGIVIEDTWMSLPAGASVSIALREADKLLMADHGAVQQRSTRCRNVEL